MKNNDVCTSIGDKEHYFHHCESINEVSQMFKIIGHKILQKKNIQDKDLLDRVLSIGVWNMRRRADRTMESVRAAFGLE